jgi:hypothetical protein
MFSARAANGGTILPLYSVPEKPQTRPTDFDAAIGQNVYVEEAGSIRRDQRAVLGQAVPAL